VDTLHATCFKGSLETVGFFVDKDKHDNETTLDDILCSRHDDGQNEVSRI